MKKENKPQLYDWGFLLFRSVANVVMKELNNVVLKIKSYDSSCKTSYNFIKSLPYLFIVYSKYGLIVSL